MKVILLQDVAKIGQRGSIAQVKPGFAQNFLFPRGLAEVATKAKEAASVKFQDERVKVAADTLDALERSLAVLKAPITISAKANEQGHLFEGVGAEKIAEAASALMNVEVPSDVFSLEHPLKEVGKHEVPTAIGGWKGSVAVEITAE